jgi:hypothetical protein
MAVTGINSQNQDMRLLAKELLIDGSPVSGAAVTWANISGKPAVVASGVDAPTARTSIGLGTLSTLSTITSAEITDGTIVNADIGASAAVARTKLAAHGIVSLTDSSGGASGGNTVPAVAAATAATTDTSAASLTSTNAAITAIKNDIATLAAKVNALLAAV